MSGKGKGRAAFADESDEDPVATHSTAESEQLEEYGVERILLEQQDEEGETQYLIKWEGYSLGRSNWEPAENILDPLIIEQWEEEKRRIRRGESVRFDEDEWTQAVEEIYKAKEDRKKRRKAKRRKRGIDVSSDSDEEGEGGNTGSLFVDKRTRSPDEVPPRTTKRVRQPEVKRKGLAQKVSSSRRRNRSVSPSSSNSDEESAKSSDADSLFEELAASNEHEPTRPTRARAEETRPRATTRRPTTGEAPAQENNQAQPESSKLVERTKQAPSIPGPPRVPPKTVAAPASRKSASSIPSTTTSAPKAKRTNNIMGNWDADKSRNRRPRVSGATPKDSSDPKFHKISTQNRFQKYSRNELAPDPNALKMIDPKSGKNKPSANITGEDGVAGNAQDAYRRRTPPPEQPPDPPIPGPTDVSSAAPSEPAARSVQNQGPATEKWETCWYWTQGICRYGEETCRRAHRHTGTAPVGKQLTCYYWKTRGYCTKREESCQHAHYDTGHCAPRPPDAVAPLESPALTAAGSVLSARKSLDQNEAAPQVAARTGSGITPPDRREQPSRDVGTKDTTCYFWMNGKCTKPDGMCKFAHRDTGYYAGPPGTFKRGTGNSSLVTNANAVLVANRERIVPQSARSPEPTVPVSDRSDALPPMLQTAVQTARPDHLSPIPYTASPVHIANASSHEQTPQTPQWNILGAAMNRRASAPNFSMKATLLLLTEESRTDPIDVKLDIQDVPTFNKLARPDPVLRVEEMVTASDFEHIIWNEGLRGAACSTGGIFVDSTQAAAIQNITEVCKNNVSGLIATAEGHGSKMLIYPGNAEEWRFLDHELELSSECVLHLRLFKDLPEVAPDEPPAQPAILDDRPPAVALGEDLVKLDSEILFPSKDQRKARAVFLIMPPTHQAELDVYAKYFAGLNCKVYHSAEPGAWDFFRKTYSSSCVVVIHPDAPLWQIPGLHTFLSSTGGGVRVFSIGFNSTVALLENREPEFGCERLFPHGMVVFITDDTFVNEPEQATEIVQAFLNTHKNKPVGGQNNRIAARPGIMEWLMNLALAKTSERGRVDTRWMKLFTAMSKLARLDIEDEDTDSSEGPTSARFLVSLSPELLPSLEALGNGGDDEAATDLAVDWFAGWSLLHASKFRRFIVCHGHGSEEKDPREWGRKYQHLGVAPPKAVVPLLKK